MAELIKQLKQANIGWLYYKRYYHEVDFSLLDKDKSNKEKMQSVNATIESFQLRSEQAELLRKPFARVAEQPRNEYMMRTTYPGLLSGSGYTHETNRLGEYKIGFFFDHTTGMPCLPGHSVKGKLRSFFPNWKSDSNQFQEEKQKHILTILQDVCGVDTKESFDIFLSQNQIYSLSYTDRLFTELLENIIFEGMAPSPGTTSNTSKEQPGSIQYKPLSIYRRDIFYDAYITNPGKEYRFLGSDAITPHSHPLKEPIPLAFLKVLPGVDWKFQFNLKDNLISAAEKLSLFLNLLENFGIGAKTNVGYGQFKKVSVQDTHL